MSSNKPDPVWERIRKEAAEHAGEEPILASFLHSTILNLFQFLFIFFLLLSSFIPIHIPSPILFLYS